MFGKKKTPVQRPELPAWPFVFEWLSDLEAVAWDREPSFREEDDNLTATVAGIEFPVNPEKRQHVESSPSRFGIAVKTGDSPTGMLGAGQSYEQARDEALELMVKLFTMGFGEDAISRRMADKEGEYPDLYAVGTWQLAHKPNDVLDVAAVQAIRQTLAQP